MHRAKEKGRDMRLSSMGLRNDSLFWRGCEKKEIVVSR